MIIHFKEFTVRVDLIYILRKYDDLPISDDSNFIYYYLTINDYTHNFAYDKITRDRIYNELLLKMKQL